jgi:hypothetical protein
MYIVTVLHRRLNEAVDHRDFEFGTWKEIGFWLDDKGYIDSKYTVKIEIVD